MSYDGHGADGHGADGHGADGDGDRGSIEIPYDLADCRTRMQNLAELIWDAQEWGELFGPEADEMMREMYCDVIRTTKLRGQRASSPASGPVAQETVDALWQAIRAMPDRSRPRAPSWVAVDRFPSAER